MLELYSQSARNNCMFHILQEVSAERKGSSLDPITLQALP